MFGVDAFGVGGFGWSDATTQNRVVAAATGHLTPGGKAASVKQQSTVNYYVATTGNDSTGAGTIGSPWLTIQKALDNCWGGQIYNVFIRAGTYAGAWWVGTPDTHLRAYNSEAAILDGGTTYPVADFDFLLLIDGDRCSVQGLEVRNSGIGLGHFYNGGINARGKSVRVANCVVHDINRQGIQIAGDFSIAENNTVYQTNLVNNPAASNTHDWGSGLACSRNEAGHALYPGICYGATLRNNTVYNNYGEGLSLYEARACVAEDNVVYDNWAVNHYISDALDCVSQRNLVYRSASPAIAIGNTDNIAMADEVLTVARSARNTVINNMLYGGTFSAFDWAVVTGQSGLVDCLIANNTLVNCVFKIGAGTWTDGLGSHTLSHVGTTVANNIFYGSSNTVQTSSGLTFQNNVWPGTRPANAVGSGDVLADPLITAGGSTSPGALVRAFFALSSSSPAINAGASFAQITVDGNNVARSGATDIGAYEFIAGSQSVAAGAGHALAAGKLASVTRTANQTIAAGVGHVAASGKQASVSSSANAAITANTGHASAAGKPASVVQTASRSIAAQTGHALATGKPASVAQTGNQSVAASPGHALSAGKLAAVLQSGGIVVAAQKGALVASGKTCSVVISSPASGGQKKYTVAPRARDFTVKLSRNYHVR